MGFVKHVVFDMCGVIFEAASAHEYQFTPLREGVAVLQACAQHAQDTGVSLHVCSNLTREQLTRLGEQYPDIMGVFTGLVSPCVAHAKKPEQEIFTYLMKQFTITPHEAVFIDDQERNVIAAQHAGMVGLHAYDMAQVRNELVRFGVIRD